MLENLTQKITTALGSLAGKKRLNEKNIEQALKEVRLSLLEADVNYQVVKEFIDSVKARALGAEVGPALDAYQQFVKICNEELTSLMGGENVALDLHAKPPVPIMIVGLQGSGKTTTTAKIAAYLRNELGRRPLLVPADVYRPAAIDQLKTLGEKIGVGVFDSNPKEDPVKICRKAFKQAGKMGYDTLLIDTAGRLHIDEEMMRELTRIKDKIDPHQILYVADSMAGQDAVTAAAEFNQQLDFDGIVLTKIDGDARGGAALSIKMVTGKPIIFLGAGEKPEALEPFHPDRLSSRILGMGDVMTLIEKAEKVYSEEEAQAVAEKMLANEFSLEDFRDQLRQIKKLGSMENLLKMIPGVNKMLPPGGLNGAEEKLARTEAIIGSMTKAERQNANIVNGSRRKRIATGSGTSVAEVNKLIKDFSQMKKMLKRMNKQGPGAFPGGGMPAGLENLMRK